jgi:hypothetical protein
VRDLEVIDSELRLLLAIRHMAREEEGRTPSTARICLSRRGMSAAFDDRVALSVALLTPGRYSNSSIDATRLGPLPAISFVGLTVSG